ncbi:hypothetical protein BRC81_08335 [Halobacteriales archaeon QS_1_68_20]|nr:MAG: hypothetical protein BRC81_08335 [Halobacteriales archaeon QS_1_68_20]
MNLDELRSVQNKERQKDSLQHLRESFYEDVAGYLEGLEAERDRAAEEAEDPFASAEVQRLTDEIETAKDVTQAIYERRLGKLVKRASLAAADMPADDEGLTAEERELFNDLVDRIEANKSHVLDVVEGEADSSADSDRTTGSEPDVGPTGVSDSLQTDPESSVGVGRSTDEAPDGPTDGRSRETAVPADPATDREVPPPEAAADPGREPPGTADGSAGGPPGEPPGDSAGGDLGDSSPTDADPEADSEQASDEAPSADLDDRTTVRITRDVGEIFGVDEREYDLATEEVVTLPSANAEPLLERGAAERID